MSTTKLHKDKRTGKSHPINKLGTQMTEKTLKKEETLDQLSLETSNLIAEKEKLQKELSKVSIENEALNSEVNVHRNEISDLISAAKSHKDKM